MEKDSTSGPSCSLESRPDGSTYVGQTKIADLAKVRELIKSNDPVVLIIDAEWCGDCRNQMKNLPQFEEDLKRAGIEVYIFTAEGPVYDQFVSPQHKELAMTLYSAPIGAPLFGDSPSEEDVTSVMAKRGREGYPAIFFISNGAVRHWSIEDVSVRQLETLSKSILDKLK